MPFNQVHDKVYIRDEHLEWLPGVVLEIDDDRALISIDLPGDWNETTLSHNSNAAYSYNELNHQKRWVLLKDYYDRRLPLQSNQGISRDMIELTNLHEAEVLYQIKARYTRSSQNPYTRVGDMIVAVNSPRKATNGLYSIDRQLAYAKKYLLDEYTPIKKQQFEEKKEDGIGSSWYNRDMAVLTYEPHLYEISSLAYKNIATSLKIRKQAIIVSGESGSGKTESCRLILQHLASLPNLLTLGTSSKALQRTGDSGELVQRVIESSRILESFGNAKIGRHASSSRFAKVVQLQFSTEEKIPSLIGSTINTYLLEASRVVTTTFPGEANFHIFYQLLASPNATKLSLLGERWVNTVFEDFRYLNAPNNIILDSSCGTSNLDDWDSTVNAMKLFCWEGASLKMVIQALGIILCLGNITFDMNSRGEAMVSSKDSLVILAQEMDLPLSEIEQALTGRNIVTAYQETIRVPYTVGNAYEARDGLAKAIYASLFASIVRQINLLTCSTSSQCKVISVADIFGFDSSQHGLFQQFCINYVNERMQQKYVDDILSRYKLEFDTEDIELQEWKDFDNSLTIDLLDGTSGIIPLLNKQTGVLNGSSEIFASEVKHLNRNHERLLKEKSEKVTQFSIRHFAGVITYDGTKFVELNKTSIPDDLVSICAKCSNPLISQELVKLTAPSHKRNLSLDTIKAKTNPKHLTVMDKIKKQLNELIKSLENSETHYVRCIKNSEDKTETRQMDHCTVLRQLRCAGLVIAVDIIRDAHAHRVPYHTVEQKFACLIDSTCRQNIKDMELHDRVQIMMSILFAPIIERYRDSEFTMPFACGNTKVFFRGGAMEILELRRAEYLAVMATRLQKWQRKVIMKRSFKIIQRTIVRTQAIARKRPVRRAFQNKRRSAIKIQSLVKSLKPKKFFVMKRASSIVIQRWYRALRMKKHFKSMSQAVTKISNWRKEQKYRNMLFRKRWFSTVIPIYLKAMKQLKCYDAKKRHKFTRTIQQTYSLFTHKVPFKLLEERFMCLIPPNSLKAMAGMEDNDKAQLMMLILFSPFIEECRNHKTFPMPFACGKTRVYFRPGSLEVLEILRREHYTIAVLKLQQWVRKATVQRQYQNKRNSVIRMQNHFRAEAAKNSKIAVMAYIRTLEGMGYVTPVYKAALAKALRNERQLFPYSLSYSVINNRFANVLPHAYAKSLDDMDPSDKTKYILSVLFTPFVQQSKSKALPMPFSCKETGVCLKVGSLELLEILRTEKLQRSSTKIQSLYRSRTQVRKFRKALIAVNKIQRWYKEFKARYIRYRKSAVVIQKWARTIHWKEKETMKHQHAAKKIASISRIFLSRLKREKEREHAKILTSWARSTAQRKRFNETIRAVTLLQAQVRRKIKLKAYLELKKYNGPVRDPQGSRKTQRFRSLRNVHRRNLEKDLSAAKEKENGSNNKPIVTDQKMSLFEAATHSDKRIEEEIISNSETSTLSDVERCNFHLMTHQLQYPDIAGTTVDMNIEVPGTPKDYSISRNAVFDTGTLAREEETLKKTTAGTKIRDMQLLPKAVSNGFENGQVHFDLSEISLNESIFEKSQGSDQSIAQPTDLQAGEESSDFDSPNDGAQLGFEQLRVHNFEETNFESPASLERSKHQTLYSPQTRDPASESSNAENHMRETTDKSSEVQLSSDSADNPDLLLNGDRYTVLTLEHLPMTQGIRAGTSKTRERSASNIDVDPLSSQNFLEKEQYYKAQVESLRNDIMQVTAEADIHNQEIEAEYEERLAAYESEVLQLHQNIQSLEEEKAALKKNFVLAKESYEEDIKHFKEAMKRAEESHRKYLKQVVASVEKSKVENTKALDSVKQGRDAQIRHLEELIERLKQENSLMDQSNLSHPQGGAAVKEAQRLARKLEKIVSPQHIIKMSETFRNEPKTFPAKINEKISYKAKNIISRMERMVIAAIASPQTINVIAEEAEREVRNLEQQLVHAYEEIEKLESELVAAKKSKYKDASGRRKRNFF